MYGNNYVKVDDVKNAICKACEEYSISYGKEYGGFAEKMATLTDKIPMAEVNIKIGKWHINKEKFAVCSQCGGSYYQEPHGIFLYKYCPHCGSKMEGLE